MRFDELDELHGEDADAAIAELVSTSGVGELADIVRSGPHQLAGRAIDGLAEIGGAEAASALIELLEEAIARPPRWGSEQEIERESRQRRLVRSVARARGVAPPAGGTQEEIAEFIESCRER